METSARHVHVSREHLDILFGEDGPVVCEVNSNAHMKNILMCTGINVADHIIRYVVSVINNE